MDYSIGKQGWHIHFLDGFSDDKKLLFTSINIVSMFVKRVWQSCLEFMDFTDMLMRGPTQATQMQTCFLEQLLWSLVACQSKTSRWRARSVGYLQKWKQGQTELLFFKHVWKVKSFRRQRRTQNRSKTRFDSSFWPWFAKQDFKNLFLNSEACQKHDAIYWF